MLTWVSGGALLHDVSTGSTSSPGKGLLSIKTMFAGVADYQVGSGRYRVGAGRFLLLNDRQTYRVEVPAGVESLCVFFERRCASEVYRGPTEHHEALLDDPRVTQSSPACRERSIADICFDLGSSSLGTFSRRFKERYGMSPSEFRRNAQHPGRLAAAAKDPGRPPHETRNR